MTERRAIALMLVYAGVAVVLVVIRLPPAVALVCLAPFVLFVPGATIVLALGGLRRQGEPARWAILSVVMSMAVLALGGLALNVVSPLTTAAWTVWILLVTAVGAVSWWIRTHYLSGTDERAPVSSRDRPVPRPPPRVLGCILAAAVLVAAAAVVTELSAHHAYDQPVTQLTIVKSGTSSGAVVVSIVNLSSRSERLRLTVHRGTQRSRLTRLTLRPDAVWRRRESVGRGDLTASLQRPGETRPFAEVAWKPTAPPESR